MCIIVQSPGSHGLSGLMYFPATYHVPTLMHLDVAVPSTLQEKKEIVGVRV
jgi:hypothetical protein